MTSNPISEAFGRCLKEAEVTTLEISCHSRLKEVQILEKRIYDCIIQIIDKSSSKQIALGLDEAFRNAYEHGNLELSAIDKQKLLENENLERELELRESKFGKRKITAKLSISKSSFAISIADEGAGFDWQKIDGDQNATKSDSVSLRGRGLKIMNSAFDKVYYNESGNICYLEKTF